MRTMLLIVWVLQGCLLVYGLAIVTPLRFGFAPALSATLWLAVAIYAFEKWRYPQLRLHFLMLAALIFATVLAYFYPGRELHPSTSAYMPIHWITGMVSYALFVLAALHAHMLTKREKNIRKIGQGSDALAGDMKALELPILTQERLMFNFVIAGFVLLTLTLVIGLGFRENLYGSKELILRDHKAVFALLSWLVFAGLLAGRYVLGLRGRRAVRLIYAGALLLLLSYIGSRFVLEVLLIGVR